MPGILGYTLDNRAPSGEQIVEKPPPCGRNATVPVCVLCGENSPRFSCSRKNIFREYMPCVICYVFRPSKLHLSSSGLTIRSRDHPRPMHRKNHRQDPETETDLWFQWRALTSPSAFIFRYGERMRMRKTEVKRASARLVSPFNRAFGIRSSDFIKSHSCYRREKEIKKEITNI